MSPRALDGAARRQRRRRRQPARWLAPLAAVMLLTAGCASGVPDGPSESPPPAPARTGPDPAPAQLVGLDAGQLDSMLGPADFTRADGPAQIRQYREAGCILDVFLYSDAAGSYHVTHIDGRDRSPSGDEAASSCAASVIHARRLRAAG